MPIHDTHMSQWIPPSQIQKSAGTWTPTFSTNKVFDRRTANDSAFNLFVPIPLLSNSSIRKGSKIATIDLFYNITVELADDFATVTLTKQSLSSVGAHTAAEVTAAVDTGHDTAAERKATGEHKMTITLGSLATPVPAWIDDDELYILYCVVDMGANGVFDLVGARANFTLRA